MEEYIMKKPVLVIMAAGMGSRYGGLKQIDPIDDQGHIIMDFSIFDAKRAGFEKVVFIIKKENENNYKKHKTKIENTHISHKAEIHEPRINTGISWIFYSISCQTWDCNRLRR